MQPTSSLALRGRVSLFAKLVAALDWQVVGGKEKLNIAKFMKDDPRFDFPQLAHERLETFLGKTVGGRDVPVGFTLTERGRFFEQPGTLFTINDKCNPSNDYGWPLIEEFATVQEHVIDVLRKALGKELGVLSNEDIFKLLQCNVNLYGPTATLTLHRDDGTRKTETGAYVSTTDTFFPAAVTVVLTPDENPSRSFVLWTCLQCFKAKEAMQVKACKKRGHKVRRQLLPRDDETGIICLQGNGYCYGVHGIEEPAIKATRNRVAIERLSLNFRVVRQEAWDILRPDSKVPKTRGECDD